MPDAKLGILYSLRKPIVIIMFLFLCYRTTGQPNLPVNVNSTKKKFVFSLRSTSLEMEDSKRRSRSSSPQISPVCCGTSCRKCPNDLKTSVADMKQNDRSCNYCCFLICSPSRSYDEQFRDQKKILNSNTPFISRTMTSSDVL